METKTNPETNPETNFTLSEIMKRAEQQIESEQENEPLIEQTAQTAQKTTVKPETTVQAVPAVQETQSEVDLSDTDLQNSSKDKLWHYINTPDYRQMIDSLQDDIQYHLFSSMSTGETDRTELFKEIKEAKELSPDAGIKDIAQYIVQKKIHKNKQDDKEAKKNLIKEIKQIKNSNGMDFTLLKDLTEKQVRTIYRNLSAVGLAELLNKDPSTKGYEKSVDNVNSMFEQSKTFSFDSKDDQILAIGTSVYEILQTEYPEEVTFCEKTLPIQKGSVTIITAEGGVGKSYLSLRMTIDFLEQDRKAKAFVWMTEDGATKIKNRINEILGINRSQFSVSKVPDRYGNLSEETKVQITKRMVDYDSIEERDKLLDIVELYDLVIIDPLIKFIDGDENSNQVVGQFMTTLQTQAQQHDTAVVIIHHNNKDGNPRGASAAVANARLGYVLNKEGNKITVQKIKDNYQVAHGLEDNRYYDVDYSADVLIQDSHFKRSIQYGSESIDPKEYTTDYTTNLSEKLASKSESERKSGPNGPSAFEEWLAE